MIQQGDDDHTDYAEAAGFDFDAWGEICPSCTWRASQPAPQWHIAELLSRQQLDLIPQQDAFKSPCDAKPYAPRSRAALQPLSSAAACSPSLAPLSLAIEGAKRAYDVDTVCRVLAITFAALEPPGRHQFVGTCKRAGITHVLALRDTERLWYRVGWSALMEALEEEIQLHQPEQVVLVGASLGGYAAIRAALELQERRDAREKHAPQREAVEAVAEVEAEVEAE
eukprot:6207667-Pleurochrysis_carterae.AAC.1